MSDKQEGDSSGTFDIIRGLHEPNRSGKVIWSKIGKSDFGGNFLPNR